MSFRGIIVQSLYLVVPYCDEEKDSLFWNFVRICPKPESILKFWEGTCLKVAASVSTVYFGFDSFSLCVLFIQDYGKEGQAHDVIMQYFKSKRGT